MGTTSSLRDFSIYLVLVLWYVWSSPLFSQPQNGMFWGKLYFINISSLSPIIHVLLIIRFWYSYQEVGDVSPLWNWVSSCGFCSLKKNCRNDSRWFWKLDHKRLCGFLLVGWNVMLGYEICSHHMSIPFSLRPSSCEARLGRLSALRRSACLLLPWTPAAPATIWLQPNRNFKLEPLSQALLNSWPRNHET